MQVGHFEQLLAGGAGVDQGADVGLAGGDDPVERGDDALVGLQGLQAPHIGLGRRHEGGLGRRIAGLLIHRLLRNGLRGQEGRPALGGQDREVLIGLGGRQVAAGLFELLVELGRVDRGQDLARLDRGADVLAPGLQVAADPGVDLRRLIGLDHAGQAQLGRTLALQLGQGDRGRGLGAGPAGARLGVVGPGDQATGAHGEGEDDRGAAEQLEPADVGGLDGVGRHGWGSLTRRGRDVERMAMGRPARPAWLGGRGRR